MAEESTTRSSAHLSIGEVLALLLEEFPDITISKIRFLESQGLIDPERTSSGYRKFYDDDVELLRCILREQKENFLPLRVIKDRLDSGEIDPTNETPRPRGIMNVADDSPDPGSHPSAGGAAAAASSEHSRRDHPSSHGRTRTDVSGQESLFARTDEAPTAGTPRPDAADRRAGGREPAGTASVLPGVLLTATELCSMAGISSEDLAGLESYGVVQPTRGSAGGYDEDALEIASIAKQFLDVGVDARHLRGWRVAADRETNLYEQLVQPLIRQRNPTSHAQALAQLREFEEAGGKLRTAMMRSALRRFDH